MSPSSGVGLPEALERAASALVADADAIRPANGDPGALLAELAPESAARVLRWLLEHEPEDGAELAEEWCEDAGSGSTAVLAVAEAGLPKAGRKALRRIRHRLRSRGVVVLEAAPTPTVATLPRVEEAIDAAVLSPLDPRGHRAAFLVTSHPSGGARVFELVADEVEGVLDCRVYSAGRSKVRQFLKEFEGQVSAVSAPSDSVRAWIARVAEAQRPSRPAPRMFSEWRGDIARAPEGVRTPGELARDALGALDDPAALERAATLVREAKIGPWPPLPELLQELVEKLTKLGEGTLVVSPAARREQSDQVLEEALPRIYAEPHADRTAARFEEAAYVFWKNDAEDDARACLAAAASFRAGEPAANPVARVLLEVVLEPALRKLEDGGDAGGADASGVET
jgi:hypothetical protein